MKFAAIILAFKEPELVNLLIKQLLREFGDDIHVFIHVSNGSTEMIPTLISNEQITVLPEHIGGIVDPSNKRMIGMYGTNYLLKKILYSFDYALNNYNPDYFLLLSGQDMLVKSGLKQFLIDHKDTIFMDGEVSDKKQRARLLYKWGPLFKTKYNFKYHPIRIMRRLLLSLYSLGLPINKQRNSKLFDGMTICKNLYWMNLPVDSVNYLLQFKEENKEIMKIFMDSMCPEESFFSTVLYNSKAFRDRINWSDKYHYVSTTYFGKFTTSFAMLEESDLPLIEESGCYFAKKFSLSYNEKLVRYFYKKTMGEDCL